MTVLRYAQIVLNKQILFDVLARIVGLCHPIGSKVYRWLPISAPEIPIPFQFPPIFSPLKILDKKTIILIPDTQTGFILPFVNISTAFRDGKIVVGKNYLTKYAIGEKPVPISFE